MPESNLKVRIVMKPSGEAKSVPASGGAYEYYWGRIALIVLLVSVVGFFAGRELLSMSKDSSPELSVETENVESETSRVLPGDISTSNAGDTPSADLVVSGPAVEKTLPAEVESLVVEEVIVEEVKVEPVELEVPVKDEVVEVAKKNTPVIEKSASKKQNSGPALTNEKTVIHSSVVKRFVLVSGVKQREPVGSINTIFLDGNDIATAYVYSEVVGLKDKYLNYIWKKNGKEIAKVKVGVWGDSWRSYSRKYLNQKMRGNLSVELRTLDGKLLAETSFQF